MLSLFWNTVITVGALAAFVQLVRKGVRGHRTDRVDSALIVFLLCVTGLHYYGLLSLSHEQAHTSQLLQNKQTELDRLKREHQSLMETREQQLASTEEEARALLSCWGVMDLRQRSDGELLGILLGGMRLLEEHSRQSPETYKAAKALLAEQMRETENATGTGLRRERLVEGAEAMLQLIEGLGGGRYLSAPTP